METLQNILKAIVNVDNVKLLEDFVKDLDVAESSTYCTREDSILHYAIKKSSPGCVELLVKRSLSTDSVTDTLVKTTLQEVYNYAILAATVGNAKALGVILRKDSKVEAIDKDQLEKLIHFSAKSQAEDSVESLRLLLDDYNVNIEERNDNRETPLHVAALSQ